MKKFLHLALVALLLGVVPTACNEKESGLGVNLQDPFTLYTGTRDTITVEACTVFDDSLLTMNQNFAIIGHYADETYGSVESRLFSQVVPPSTTGFNLDSINFDSVVITLVVDEWYNAPANEEEVFQLHFEVVRLAEAFDADKIYYSTDSLSVSTDPTDCYFDEVVNCTAQDSVIVLHLNTAHIESLFPQSETSEEFLEQSKGLRIRIKEGSARVMPSVNLAATNNRIVAYYTYGCELKPYSQNFIFGVTATATAKHFTQFLHQHSTLMQGLANGTVDSLAGSESLYLSPMGGTMVKINLNQWITAFHQDHPMATIHYAELIAPVADATDGNPPQRILAYKTASNGIRAAIPDLLDAYSYAGFDGSYNADGKYYRMRVTQHLQQLLRSGEDLGTLLLLDGRLSKAQRTIINGTQANNPIHIEFIYSE